MVFLYKSVSYDVCADGYSIKTDKTYAITPLGKPLVLPNRKIADAVSKEWAAQQKNTRKDTMNFTQFACVAIDLVSEKRSAVIEEVLPYAETDLVCYRAGNIPVLQERQDKALNPIIAWAEHHFKIELAVTDSLMPVLQSSANIIQLRTFLSDYDDWKLAIIASVIKPLGSLILALALTEKHFNAEDIFLLSQLEEAYETGQWGDDEEKQARAQKIREEILAAGRFIALLD